MSLRYLTAGLFFVSTAVFAGYTAPNGFRDMLWSSSSTAVDGGMTLIEEEGDLKCYKRNRENLNIGKVDLKSIGYCYDKDKLDTVNISFKGFANFTTLREALIQKYETPYRSDQYKEEYIWGMGSDSNVYIMLTYSDINEKGSLTYRYKQNSEEEKLDQKQRAAEVANEL